MEAQNAVREREKVLNEEVVRLREELERQKVSQTAVLEQKKTSAAASAVAAGDTDGGPRSQVDPAYDAHTLSIGEWATAAWEGWEKERALNTMVNKAIKEVGRCQEPVGDRVWTCWCYGCFMSPASLERPGCN